MAQPANARQRRALVVAGQIAFLPTGILTTLLGPMLPILSARWALSDAQAGNRFLIQFLAQLAGVISQHAGNLRAGLAVPFVATVILFLIHLREW